ncbi:hypothetical protein FOZ60_004769 [Perkinsus olseni]|uniref:FHA domain-containing protein n=1 Tax=Perkinsus olseni TaxID=32597 RepID=A0A7J6NSR2_PEROL|nr:hypothetical protein FOZ60_004769 [Perkinsus olseni]
MTRDRLTWWRKLCHPKGTRLLALPRIWPPYSCSACLKCIEVCPCSSLSLSIGRAPSNDIVLMDRCVSRTHVVLRWQRDEATQSMLAPTIEPLSTSSATWVQIPSLAELPLIAGMSLKLGTESTECRVIRADSESLVLHMPADTVLETPDSSCLPAEMDYGDLVTKIRYSRRGLNTITIGRSRSNSLVIHADRSVSSFHCQIVPGSASSANDALHSQNRWYFTDLGGTGTAICLPRGSNSEHPLFNNDVLYIGNTSIKMQMSYHP